MVAELDFWQQQLRKPDVNQRREAAQQIAALQTDAQAAAVLLLEALADPDDQVREWANAALESLGPPRASDLPALETLLADPESDRAYWAATLIGRLGAAGSAAVSALSRTLQEAATLAVRERAAWALGEIGPAAQDALPFLRRAAHNGPTRLARLAAQAIARIQGETND